MNTQQPNYRQDNSNDGHNAAVTAIVVTVVMTGYLWGQIVTGLVPPVV